MCGNLGFLMNSQALYRSMVLLVLVCLVGGMAGVYIDADRQLAGTGYAVRALTGHHTRIVWCRQVGGDTADVAAEGASFRLMGLDTDDRQGERSILPQTGSYHKPMITPRGDRVVFSDRIAGRIGLVDWNGTSLTWLPEGRAAAVWMDPSNGVEWVYAFPPEGFSDDTSRSLIRFQIDNPMIRETVWDATPSANHSIQLSTDGTHIGGLFRVPAMINLGTGKRRELGRGCWTSLSPDNRYLLWVFDGAHRNVVIHTADGAQSWTVDIHGAPGIDGFEVFHPRWSNRTRFMCMTGPYRVGGGDNRIRGGGAGVEVYVGRFNERLTAIEQWVQVTHDQHPDYFPDVWIDPRSDERVDGLPVQPDPGADTSHVERLVVEARLIEMTPVPTLASIAPYKQALIVHAYDVERVLAGTYPASRILVAHWAIKGEKTLPIDKRIAHSYTLTLDPYSRRKELEGERLVIDVADSRHPLYYAIETP